MTPFGRTLDNAGILDQESRRSYRSAARSLLRADTSHFVAVRLLVPSALQPHLLAAYWFAHATDQLADSGPLPGRRERYDRWTESVRSALDHGAAAADDPVRLTSFLRTVTDCRIPVEYIARFLSGMRDDTACTGLSDEQDFERYVDRVSLPFLLLLFSVHPGCRAEGQIPAFRLLAAACQRIDFLADLADDTRAARARLPREALADQIARARAALRAAQPVLDLTPLELRPMMHVFLRMHALHLETIERSGDRVLHRRVGHPAMATVRLLLAGQGQVRHV